MNIPRPPYIKGENFCANPVAKWGIPQNADSIRNPKVAGTPEHQKFWETELSRILNGYTTGGIFIPGRYYYYLNYKIFDTPSGPMRPYMCDLHLELAYIIEYCKANGRNLIMPKSRRVGASEAGVCMIVDYGYRFGIGYRAGVAAGQEIYVQDFMKKWSADDERMVSEFTIKKLPGGNNKDEKIAGYRVKEENGFRDMGTFNSIVCRTMFQNPNLFKGLYLNDVVAEELGEFEMSTEFYSATKDCLMQGATQVGTFFAWGTGGQMSGDAGKNFEYMYTHPEEFNAEVFFIDARRGLHPFIGGCPDIRDIKEHTPNLQDLTPEERIGVEDTDAAEAYILAERERLLKGRDVKKYIEFCQNRPLDDKEVFAKTVSNKFDQKVLNDIGWELSGLTKKRYNKWKIEFVKTDKGEYVTPLQTKLVPAQDTDKEDECVLISDDGMPNSTVKNLYTCGLDSYDQDESKTSKSLGAMLVRIRSNDLKDTPQNKPVCVVRMRPRRKEIFYEMCLKVAVHYNLVNAVLVDVRQALVMDYFKKNSGEKFLAYRPTKFESENSEQKHEYGVSLNKYSRPRMVAIMQTDVLDNGHKFDFPDLVQELKNYDEFTEGSDNDLADAYGMALMQDVSMELRVRPVDEKEDDRFVMYDHETEDKTYLQNIQQDRDSFGSTKDEDDY